MTAGYEVGAATYESIIFGQAEIPTDAKGCGICFWF
jgi:hypothetical protein